MDFGIAGKTALVAAASRGLGFAAAKALAAEGASVVICGRTASTLEAAAADIASDTGAVVLPVVADVSNASEVHQLFTVAKQKLGAVDILVTNAGGPPAGGFADVDDAAWAKGVELTLMGVMRMIRLALPDMRQKHWGRIVNITSVSVKQPIEGLLISNAIRPAVIGLAKTLADEVAADGITVNNVCPGWTKTERVDELMRARAAKNGTTPEQESMTIEKNLPMRRMGKPEELAAMIAFLCSTRASYVTGTTILVDGGAYRGLM